MSDGGRKSRFDVAIIGGGPGGYVAAIKAGMEGARVLLIEEDKLGGTCLNRGCIPTKVFLSAARVLRKLRKTGIFEGADQVSVDPEKLVRKKSEVVDVLRRGIAFLLRKRGVTVEKGRGSLRRPTMVEVGTEKGELLYEAENIIIATGSRAASISGAGIDGSRIISSDEALGFAEIPDSMIIVGGGAVGVEFASIYSSFGSRVTLLEMLPRILPREDEEVSRLLSRALKKEGIEVLTGAKVLSARAEGKKVRVEIANSASGRVVRTADRVLVAVGRSPRTEDLGLEEMGVKLENGFVKVNSRMETNVDGIYAVGDVIGAPMLAHSAFAEGLCAVANIMGKTEEVDYGKIPSCMFGFPQVASFGVTEAAARRSGEGIVIGRSEYRSSGRAAAEGETDGFVKILAREGSGEIIGIHMIGEDSVELISAGLVAAAADISVEELAKVVIGHPTFSEMLVEAALDCRAQAIHKVK